MVNDNPTGRKKGEDYTKIYWESKGVKKVTKDNETAEQKFSRLASVRGTKALKAIKALEPLSGRMYSYTPEQVETLMNALKDQVEILESKFTAEKKKEDIGVDL